MEFVGHEGPAHTGVLLFEQERHITALRVVQVHREVARRRVHRSVGREGGTGHVSREEPALLLSPSESRSCNCKKNASERRAGTAGCVEGPAGYTRPVHAPIAALPPPYECRMARASAARGSE